MNESKLDELEKQFFEEFYSDMEVDMPYIYEWLFREGSYIPQEIQKKMGVCIREGPISVWDRKHVQWQAAAQLLWRSAPLKKTNEITDQLLKDPKLFELLGFHDLKSVDNVESDFRAIKDVIRVVKPGGSKKGRPRKNVTINKIFTIIPMIYNQANKTIHGPSFHCAINIIAQILKNQKCEYREVLLHPLILEYKSLTSPIFSKIIDWWIQMAFHS